MAIEFGGEEKDIPKTAVDLTVHGPHIHVLTVHK